MMELRSLFLAHVLHVGLCTGAIVVDRRRLDAYGRARMWRASTLWLVGCGLFLPPLLGWYAHLTITRRGSFIKRHGIALLTTFLLVVLLEIMTRIAFSILDWPLPLSGLPPNTTTHLDLTKLNPRNLLVFC
jgi:hypothetical protein